MTIWPGDTDHSSPLPHLPLSPAACMKGTISASIYPPTSITPLAQRVGRQHTALSVVCLIPQIARQSVKSATWIGCLFSTFPQQRCNLSRLERCIIFRHAETMLTSAKGMLAWNFCNVEKSKSCSSSHVLSLVNCQ